MKIAYGTNTVLGSAGVQTTNAFGIARTPHMFNILSSGLYSDKIAAVLREISCNAMDAHIMGGCAEKPFQVKLPTQLDRSFYVKDWGPGLDDREIRELYTTYGWSSKQNNDEVTGAFGLGSKSPFAYTMQNEEDTDGFTIVSVKEGVKRIYTCHIGDEGAPAISRLHEGPADTDWPHGVMVTFPVQQRDIAEFHQKAREIYRWFSVRPEILGADHALPENSFKFSGSFFSMSLADRASDTTSCIVMGNVRYPINASRLGPLTQIEVALLSSAMHLFLPIGSVMMTPSREELQYTDRTKDGLKAVLEKAAIEVAARVREDVMTPEPTRWAWFKKIHTYYAALPFGVQRALEHFLRAAGVDEEEIKSISTAVTERAAVLPSWAGDGIEGPKRVYLRDEAGSIVRDANNDVQFEPCGDPRGVRVWLYQYDTAKKNVRRREVIRGKVRVGTEGSAVYLPFLSDVSVFYADANQADVRVRGLVRAAEDTAAPALLVMPCRGTPAAFTKEYAERLTGTEGLHGLPMAGASSLAVPGFVEAEKARKKLEKEQGPRAVFSDTEVPFLALGGQITKTVLGDLDEDSGMYYLCASHKGASNNSTFRNTDGSGGYIYFGGYYKEEAMLAIAKLVAELNLSVTGAVLVSTEAEANKLKLKEQGFKPFLPWIAAQVVANKAHFEKLGTLHDRTPNVDLSDMYRADDYGWLGILSHHFLKRTLFWSKFSKEFPASPVKKSVEDFVARVSARRKADQSDDTPVVSEALNALSEFSRRVTNASVPHISTSNSSTYEIKQVFHQTAPSFEVLNEHQLLEMMTDDTDKAIQFVRTVLAVDGLLSGVRQEPCEVVTLLSA